MKTKKKTKFGIVDGLATPPKNEEQEKEIQKLEKDFTALLYYQRKQKHNLLGDFVDGQYDIRDENILHALMKLPKKFENQDGDAVYLSTKLDDFVLNFRIDLDISYSYCDARLWLIEIEQTATEDIKHTTNLDRVVEIYSKDFKERLFENWNVYYDDQQIAKDGFLYQLLHMQREEYMFSKELIAILSQLYILRMLKFLEGFGALGEKVQIDFRRAMEEKINADPSISIDYALQKEILDSIIFKHNALNEILKDKQGREIVEGFAKPLEKIKNKSFETITENTRKEEKKEEKKKNIAPVVKKSGPSAAVTKPSPKIDYSKLFKSEFHPGSAPTIIPPMPRLTPAPQRAPARQQQTPEPVQVVPPMPQQVAPEDEDGLGMTEEERELAEIGRQFFGEDNTPDLADNFKPQEPPKLKEIGSQDMEGMKDLENIFGK